MHNSLKQACRENTSAAYKAVRSVYESDWKQRNCYWRTLDYFMDNLPSQKSLNNGMDEPLVYKVNNIVRRSWYD